jgi:riboflavin synthase
MFTGIVRERAHVVSFDAGDLVVAAALGAETGDSVAVDGICLTVTARENGRLTFHVVPETASRAKAFRTEVNLEPALRVGEPLSGHYVQGHVDGTGRVRELGRSGDDVRLRVEAPRDILRYCIEKGSIAVDGVALTITALDDDSFEVALVPHTLAATTLGSLRSGDEVNLESDVLAKYVERLVTSQ